MTTLPAKITPDAIREALFEMRFEHGILPEIAVGKLASNPRWGSFTPTRLPFGEVPEAIRISDPNLRYFPTLELKENDGGELVRIGPNVISHHIIGRYIGWDSFLPKLIATVEAALEVLPGLTIVRMGLRYLNALTSHEHGIETAYDLNLCVEVGTQRPSEHMQLVYVVGEESGVSGVVRVVSPRFVEGETPRGTAAIVDIDIATLDSWLPSGVTEIGNWLERAHNVEKMAFFSLLKPETLKRLAES